MEAARTRTAAVIGVEGHLVEVEAEVTPGLSATILVGLPDTVLREARDRVRAAIVNSGERWPRSNISVGLRPATRPKRGSAYDLAIAIAIMAANGDLPGPSEATMFLAELGLDGRLRPVPGVLPAALAAADTGITTIVVAAANQAQADLVPGLTVIASDNLTEVAVWLRGGPPPHREPPGPGSGDSPVPPPPQPDLTEVLGQAKAPRALEVRYSRSAWAGAHQAHRIRIRSGTVKLWGGRDASADDVFRAAEVERFRVNLNGDVYFHKRGNDPRILKVSHRDDHCAVNHN
jgi:magnesium chelatase family protein